MLNKFSQLPAARGLALSVAVADVDLTDGRADWEEPVDVIASITKSGSCTNKNTHLYQYDTNKMYLSMTELQSC